MFSWIVVICSGQNYKVYQNKKASLISERGLSVFFFQKLTGERFCSCNNFKNLSGDRSLSCFVVRKAKVTQQFSRIVGGFIHRRHARSVFRSVGIEQRLVKLN